MAVVSIVGGGGFIGTRLAAELREEGVVVRIVDVRKPDVDCVFVRADVRDRDSLASGLEGSKIVYNLAAAHRDDVTPTTLYEDTNVLGAVNTCDVCRELEIHKIVFTSSVAVYGTESANTIEESSTVPSSLYGYTKLRAEQVYRDWQSEAASERTLVIVRPTVVFGEGNRGNVYELIRQIGSRRFVMVGSGRNRKSMAYVGNVAGFLVYVLGFRTGVHVFNYVDGPDFTMKALSETIMHELGRKCTSRMRIPYALGYLFGVGCDFVAAATGKRLPISAVRIRKFCSTTTFSTERLIATGFHPAIGLREALVKTIREHACESAAGDVKPVG